MQGAVKFSWFTPGREPPGPLPVSAGNTALTPTSQNHRSSKLILVKIKEEKVNDGKARKGGDELTK